METRTYHLSALRTGDTTSRQQTARELLAGQSWLHPIFQGPLCAAIDIHSPTIAVEMFLVHHEDMLIDGDTVPMNEQVLTRIDRSMYEIIVQCELGRELPADSGEEFGF